MTYSQWDSTLTAHVQEVVEQQQAPGLALTVAQDGEPVYFHGFGYRDVARELPVTSDTVFGVASVTKSVTCLAVMQLADRGKLAVSDPVVKWLPEFRVPHPEWNQAITIHHLMSHSSGLPGLPCIFGARAGSIQRDPNRHRLGLAHDPFKVPPVRTYVDLMRAMAETEYTLLGPPGTCFNYSNEGFALLQGIIERASGQDFLAYAQANILAPIGMAHSTFQTDELTHFSAVTELYATASTNGRKQVFHAPGWWDVAEIYTNGSLKSTASDLLRYLEVYRTGGVVDGVRIVSAAAVRQMLKPHVPIPSGPHSYGYGLMVEPTRHGFTIVHHGGTIKGVASHVAVIPEREVTTVALANLAGFGSEAVAYAGMEAATGLPFGALAWEYPPYPVEPARLAMYVGEYRSAEGDRAHVHLVDGTLCVETGGQQLLVRPYAPDAFVWEETPFNFLRDAAGQVESLFMGVRVLPRIGSH